MRSRNAVFGTEEECEQKELSGLVPTPNRAIGILEF